ncbi:unnamed protein product [Aphis gossypii]|uniref:Uncharacterized protein n=1 Tax=Aphis gossypii TaxID=80765 RepID=A0A9P0NGK3_APHGO|nr:unnamed protein product [Aphis gossypii]
MLDWLDADFIDQYYGIYLFLKIEKTEIQNAIDWCSCNAVDIFKRKEDKKPTETTDNPEIVLTSGNELSDKNIKYSKFKIYKLFIKI